MGGPLRLVGYTETLRAVNALPKAVAAGLRDEIRHVGELVREDAEGRINDLSQKTAAGFRTYVRARGVSVEQSLRKTTGLRPDWGKTQMRQGLLPALDDKQDELIEGVETMVERVAAGLGL